GDGKALRLDSMLKNSWSGKGRTNYHCVAGCHAMSYRVARDGAPWQDLRTEQSDEWLTVSQAAAHLKVSRAAIYRFCETGRLRFYTLPTRGRRFRKKDLDALLILGRRSRRSTR